MDNNGNNNINQDPWLARDKNNHVLFFLTLTVFFSALASCSWYSFLRIHSIRIGSILSLLAGAAKEALTTLASFPLPERPLEMLLLISLVCLLPCWRFLYGESSWIGQAVILVKTNMFCPFKWIFWIRCFLGFCIFGVGLVGSHFFSDGEGRSCLVGEKVWKKRRK